MFQAAFVFRVRPSFPKGSKRHCTLWLGSKRIPRKVGGFRLQQAAGSEKLYKTGLRSSFHDDCRGAHILCCMYRKCVTLSVQVPKKDVPKTCI